MHRWVTHRWSDAWLAAAVAAVDSVIAVLFVDGRVPDALGWGLLLGAHAPLAWRRRRPLLVLCAMGAFLAPYHALDYNHIAAVEPAMVALYTVAVTGTARRTLVIGLGVVSLTLTLNALTDIDGMVEFLRISGWIVAVLMFGGYIRVHRENAAAALERAVRAERTREEEARRRVAEERLRIARDLHDLLAHSITVIGVQTSVAAHVLAADPGRLDRAAVAQALDDIAGTCRSARSELRTTLEVLRDPGAPDARGPLPGLRGLPDLAASARAAGARVELTVDAEKVPPAVGAAVYRIVQEGLTNAVRHGGREDLRIRVEVYDDGGALRLTVADDGCGAGAAVPGFGLLGMRERARSVGGTLTAGPREGRGYEVSAVLPTGERR
ncbi:sensor histidine kinase [Streptomyces sp. NPDC002328]|uniref:sensor histidine kinase n=1 Tax=Streptomyces sp. NPDC002328 TaxID=3364642 RepID=UPI0036BA90D9